MEPCAACPSTGVPGKRVEPVQQPEADARAWGGARSAESNHHVPACRLNPSNLADAAPNATGPSSKTCLCDNTAKPGPHAPARDTDRAVGTPVRGAPRPRRKVVIAATAVPRIPRLRAPLPTVRPASDWANPRQFWIVHALWPIPPQTKAELPSIVWHEKLRSAPKLEHLKKESVQRIEGDSCDDS